MYLLVIACKQQWQILASAMGIIYRYDEVGVIRTVAGSGSAPTIGLKQMPTRHSRGRDGFIGLSEWEAMMC